MLVAPITLTPPHPTIGLANQCGVVRFVCAESAVKNYWIAPEACTSACVVQQPDFAPHEKGWRKDACNDRGPPRFFKYYPSIYLGA